MSALGGSKAQPPTGKKLLSLVSQAAQGGSLTGSQERPEMGRTLLVWLMGRGSQSLSRVLRAGSFQGVTKCSYPVDRNSDITVFHQ